MNNGIIAFGNIADINKKKIFDIVSEVYLVFNKIPLTFIISGGKHSDRPTTTVGFEKALAKYGYDDIYMVDAMVKKNNEIDSYFSIFFCDEKSHIKFAHNEDIDLQLATDFWNTANNYLKTIYGFLMCNWKYNPILYSTGTHIYKFGFIDNLVKKERVHKERYWIDNFSESKNGLIRDIYNVNLLNEVQLNRPIVGNVTLRDYIHLNSLGKLLPFKDNMAIWHLNGSDMVKAEELKSKCNENTILNSPNWKFG